ncbi:hypothetical protein IWQ60_000004 [Tieghemiomyces parasiticus]|uniref:Ornithine decarboxylase antizyme n=1 Tax=Tieghemiomyces parasiticus TaxID=78921 RepID=A0A9W8AGW6_9FUNG|nr:hypothetical protein IWQ60_000004 [Tieghemiomyces parasiticus]
MIAYSRETLFASQEFSNNNDPEDSSHQQQHQDDFDLVPAQNSDHPLSVYCLERSASHRLDPGTGSPGTDESEEDDSFASSSIRAGASCSARREIPRAVARSGSSTASSLGSSPGRLSACLSPPQLLTKALRSAPAPVVMTGGPVRTSATTAGGLLRPRGEASPRRALRHEHLLDRLSTEHQLARTLFPADRANAASAEMWIQAGDLAHRPARPTVWKACEVAHQLFVQADGFAQLTDEEFRTVLLALLEFAEEARHDTAIVMAINRSQPGSADLVRAFLYAGFEMIHPATYQHSPDYVLVGYEL